MESPGCHGQCLFNPLETLMTTISLAAKYFNKPFGLLHWLERKTFFGKHKIPQNIFTCDSPLLNLPPTNITELDYFIPPPPHIPHDEHKPIDPRRAKFMIYALTRLVNDAALFYQKTNCYSDKDISVTTDLWSGKTVQVSKKDFLNKLQSSIFQKVVHR